MFSIKDKIVIVTGGNGLLGKHMISSFRRNGAIAIALDISFENLGEWDYIIDITDDVSVKGVIAEIIAKYGKIDAWINNAYPRTNDWGDDFESILVESWRKNIDMHLNGYFICCQSVLKQMKIQGFGSLINMSSIYGLIGPDFSLYEKTSMTMPAAYSAIKGGLNSFTRYLASYYGQFQIRINTVSPGGIFDYQPETFIEKYSYKVPLGRMGDAKDIVYAVLYLISDESSYITGHNLIVDGGLTIV
jgi:NAD(P)-dependent dehydrogenase (short-subunit alcohol dehydrogenase family)